MLVRLLIVLALLAVPVGRARACGPYLPEALFTYTLHPDLPLVDLAAGKLGLLQPTWARSYLYVAYHQLGGGSFDPDAQHALAALWQARLGQVAASDEPSAVARWQAARAAVVGSAVASPAIETMREIQGEVYQYYANCLDDAFVNATRTLEAKVAKVGRDDPDMRAWLTAQDQVFANCNGTTPTIPAPLPENASSSARADRAYQIAAAQLYAGRFDDAAAAFHSIAGDAASPWAPLASYLAGRSLIRKASLATAGAGADPASSAAALREIDAVIADQRASALHASARGLRDLVRLRAEPEAQVRALAARLLQPRQGADAAPALLDYTLLLDRRLEATSSGEPSGAAAMAARDALTDWLFTFQAEDEKAREHALHAWEETKAPAWLVAAIVKIAPTDARVPQLLAAADAIEPSHPGFVTIAAHAARLEIGRGALAAARQRLDDLLVRTDLPRGTINRLRGLRMAASESAADFARYATRAPVAVTYDVDGNELPDEVADDPTLGAFADGRASFDHDAVFLLNRRVPLATLLALTSDATLDAGLQRRIALAAWVRAALLQHETLAPLAARVAALAPDLASAITAATSAPAAERRFAVSVLILRTPGLGPFVRAGLDRTTALGELDEYRDNWWCGGANAGVARPDWYPDVPLAFLSADERKRADDEWARVAKLPSAPTQLAAAVVAYGRGRPKDARVAEALHLAVRATRFGCTDAGSSAQSKAAYQLLHRQYPKSEWAGKTKYYF